MFIMNENKDTNYKIKITGVVQSHQNWKISVIKVENLLLKPVTGSLGKGLILLPAEGGFPYPSACPST